jgi:F-type H+-transporting ATPase subunit b
MAEPTAHTEQPAEHHSFPPFQSEHFPSQLLWLAVSFVLLYALMSRIALPRIGAIMTARGKLIGDDLEAAERLKEQSNAAHAAYEKSLADARGRAQGIASDTHQKHLAEAEATSKKLEAQLHERLAAAEQSIAATRSAAMGNVRGIAAETATAIVQRLIGKTPADHEIAAALKAGKN